CSSAKRAVISEPERLAASTTTMPAHSPEMSRLRRGGGRGRGPGPHGLSQEKGPRAAEGGGRGAGAWGRERAGAAAGAGGGPGGGGGGGGGGLGGGGGAGRGAGEGGEPRGAEIGGEPLGETQARGRGIARADDRDRRQMQHGGLAAHGKKRRGVVDHLQPGGVIELPQRHEGDAEGLRRPWLPLRGLAGEGAGGGALRPPPGGGSRGLPRGGGRDQAAPPAPRGRRRSG